MMLTLQRADLLGAVTGEASQSSRANDLAKRGLPGGGLCAHSSARCVRRFSGEFLAVSARFRRVPRFELLAAKRRGAYGTDMGSHGNSTVFDRCELCSFCLDYRYDSPEHAALVCVGTWSLPDAAYCLEGRLSRSAS